MKKILTLTFLLIITNSCKSQSNEFSLIGKWLCVEEHGSNGAREFVNPINDGDILVFNTENTVTDKRGIKGVYKLKGDSLQITIPDNERFYILYKFKDDFKKFSLTPVTSEYLNICDEGCAFIYEKNRIDYEKSFLLYFWFYFCLVAFTKRKKHSAVVGCFFSFCPASLTLPTHSFRAFSFFSVKTEAERRTNI